MSDIKVANRFAKALFDLARERGELDQVYNDLKTIRRLNRENRELNSMFESPVIKTEKKVTVIIEVFSSLVSNTTLEFMQLLANKNREGYIPEIAESFIRLYFESKNLVMAHITTAIPLDDDLRKKFSEVVKRRTGKDVELKEKVDSGIIGGYILRVGDMQDDTSVQSKLTRLQRDFQENRMDAIRI